MEKLKIIGTKKMTRTMTKETLLKQMSQGCDFVLRNYNTANKQDAKASTWVLEVEPLEHKY